MNIDRGMVKAQRITKEGQTSTVFRPVVLAISLTPAQKQVVLQFTGRNIEQLQLSQDDLLIVTGSAAAL